MSEFGGKSKFGSMTSGFGTYSQLDGVQPFEYERKDKFENHDFAKSDGPGFGAFANFDRSDEQDSKAHNIKFYGEINNSKNLESLSSDCTDARNKDKLRVDKTCSDNTSNNNIEELSIDKSGFGRPKDPLAAEKAQHDSIIEIAEQRRKQRAQGMRVSNTFNDSGFGGNAGFDNVGFGVQRKLDDTCHSCGHTGHFTRDCPNKKCFQCQQTGHTKNECPNEKFCKRCKSTGHLLNDCPNRPCSNCQSVDHVTSACPEAPRCIRCKQEGHEIRDCPNPIERKCLRCFAKDHFVAQCPVSPKCYRCQQEGHEAAECINKAVPRIIVDDDGTTREAVLYVPTPISEEEMWKLHIAPGQSFANLTNIEAKRSGEGVDTIPIIERFDDNHAEELLCSQLRENLKKMGYVQPTAIQKNSIPVVIERRDLRAHAQTGSGKTACFMLPILQRILTEHADELNKPYQPYGLVVSPTRELAQQIHRETMKFAYGTGVKAMVSHGGVMVSKEVRDLRQGVSIVIMTPGRMKHFIESQMVRLSSLMTIVFDECDSILESGFEEEVNSLLTNPSLPEGRQLILYSATFHHEVKDLANKYLRNPIIIEIGATGSVCSDVKQNFVQLDSQLDKDEELLSLLKPDLDEYSKNPAMMESKKVLIFVERRSDADFLTDTLTDKLKASNIEQNVRALTGSKSQEERDQVMRAFREGNLPIMVATALAARGLDIQNVDHVINYDLPSHIDDYVHRVGRTGRIGHGGLATSFFAMDKDSDQKLSSDLVKVLREVQQEPPKWLLDVANGRGEESQLGEHCEPKSGPPVTETSDIEEDW